MHDEDLGHQNTLDDIAHLLALSHRKIGDFGLPEPVQRTKELADERSFLHLHHNALLEEGTQLRHQLNDEQSDILADLLHNVLNANENHSIFFIEGRPGRGKTFLIKTLAAVLRADHHIILIVGSSALSAVAYQRGRTAHYMFGIPVTDDNVNLLSSIST
ncbi:PIF1-like helicase-domain-containing protein [Pisolithus albus]|nr:PIF1-like helicase-domain-containing protein [Pisolithus albus]